VKEYSATCSSSTYKITLCRPSFLKITFDKLKSKLKVEFSLSELSADTPPSRAPSR